jgi:hypothetical protein
MNATPTSADLVSFIEILIRLSKDGKGQSQMAKYARQGIAALEDDQPSYAHSAWHLEDHAAARIIAASLADQLTVFAATGEIPEDLASVVTEDSADSPELDYLCRYVAHHGPRTAPEWWAEESSL